MIDHYPTREQAIRLLSYLPTRVDYATWIRVISAIGNNFSEAEALSILHTHWSDEKPNETARKIAHRIHSINFGALVNIAKRYGWTPESVADSIAVSTPDSIAETKPDSMVDSTPDSMVDSNWEEHSKAPLYDAQGNRLFRVAFNLEMVNKAHVTDRFFNQAVTWNTFCQLVADAGISFCPSQFLNAHGEYRNGSSQTMNHFYHIKRRNDTWVGSEMIALDFDKGMSIEEFRDTDYYEDCAFAYTTPSHTAEQHRFRAIWLLPYFITHRKAYQEVVKALVEYYGADAQCRDFARLFYGNENAIIITQRGATL